MTVTEKIKFVASVVACGAMAESCGIWLPVSETEMVTTSLSGKSPSEAMKATL